MSFWKKAVFSLAAAVLALVLIEAVLTIAGVKPVLFEDDPHVGFASQTPLFVEERGPDGRSLLATARNRLAFFNAQSFPKVRARGVCRIFSMGGSTTYGHPYADAVSFSGWLREFLPATAPERRWEVINAGGISYGSYRVARLMEELINYQPDLFIIYTGHNEFLERRIYGKVMRMPSAVRGLARGVRHLRVATLMRRAIDMAARHQVGKDAPATVLESDPVTILETTVGPVTYTRDDQAREQTLRHYRFNLGRMVDIADSVGARVIFVTPASNLRDASPFKSEHRKDIRPEDRRLWRQLYEEARGMTNASPESVLAVLDRAAALDDLPAILHFARGRALEKLGRYVEAKAAYERARDEDVCPLRALGAIRTILLEVAAERRVPVVDFETFVAERSEHGIPGASMFVDHVHTTIEGYRLLALEILKALEREGLARPNWDRETIQRATLNVTSRVDAKAQSMALVNLCKTLGWAGKRDEAYRAGIRAVEMTPNLVEARYEAGLAAQMAGRPDEAIAHYQRAIELKPTHADARCNLGILLVERGRIEEAIEHFRLALQHGKPADAKRNRENLEGALRMLRQPGTNPLRRRRPRMSAGGKACQRHGYQTSYI